jgi:hypothetical protein
MAPADMHVAASPAKVTAAKVTAAEVAAAEMASAKVTAASMSATSMAASATSKGRCRDCRTAEKDGGEGYEQCVSWHQNSPS